MWSSVSQERDRAAFVAAKIGHERRASITRGAADFAARWHPSCCGFPSLGVFSSPDLLTLLCPDGSPKGSTTRRSLRLILRIPLAALTSLDTCLRSRM